MKILVTGATGLLGNNVARQAIADGHSVITLSRSPTDSQPLQGLGGAHVQCDLNHPQIAERLDELEVDCVIHSAALIHIGWTRVEDSLRVNEQGTRTLVEWAARRNLRGVYISTVNVLPVGQPDNPAHEASLGDGQLPSAYVISKRAAQQVVNQAIQKGADWYSVYPGFMLGPYDWQLSSGRMIQALQRFMPWAPAGGCSVCDPRDVATAILRLATQGGTHRDYVLAGQNMSYMDLWKRMANQLGSKPPVIAMRLPAKVISQMWADMMNAIRQEESSFNSAAIEMAQQFHYYSSDRARKELEYRSRDTEESLNDAVQWLDANGQLPVYAQRRNKA